MQYNLFVATNESAVHPVKIIQKCLLQAKSDIRSHITMQGEYISFNAWLIKCISQAVSEYKPIHGLRKGKRKVILFEDIDISVIEREIEGVKMPLPSLVRETNNKSIGF